ncbi:MAG: hypothetical protein FJY29_04430 [Betaproteobacteria bacterium]|nr:hypothetical protein [Betaproteobacteria bacterium]
MNSTRVRLRNALLLVVVAGLFSTSAVAFALLAQAESTKPENSSASGTSTGTKPAVSLPSEAGATPPTEQGAEIPASPATTPGDSPAPPQVSPPAPDAADPSDAGDKRDSSEPPKRRTVRRAKNQKFAILSPAPASLAGKNLPYGVGVGWRQKINNESDLLTGLGSNQTLSGLTWESQLFIPHIKDLPLLNMFGLGLGVDFDFPYEIVGRDALAGETQTLEWSGLGFQISPLAQIYLQKGSLSRVWLQPMGYAYRSSKLKVNSGTGQGSSTLSLVRSGYFTAFGGEYSFLPYFHTGGEILLGWGQNWKAVDSSVSQSREGEWNYIEPRFLVSLRYPTRTSFVSIFNLSIVTGVSIELFKSKSPDVNFPGRKTAGLLSLKLGWQFQPPTSPISAGVR